jgi:tRNA/tmRNA/rRNA uracil-C5-methylase (TrmA/RlmC/RlmD family)
MSSAIKYIIDDNGHKTSVLVPVKTWENLNEKYKKLNKKLAILMGIQQGLLEVKESRVKGKSLQTLSDFLSEDNS